MANTTALIDRPDYGIDAPGLDRAFLAAGGVSLALSLGCGVAGWPGGLLGTGAAALAAAAGSYPTGMGLMAVDHRAVVGHCTPRLFSLVGSRGSRVWYWSSAGRYVGDLAIGIDPARKGVYR